MLNALKVGEFKGWDSLKISTPLPTAVILMRLA